MLGRKVPGKNLAGKNLVGKNLVSKSEAPLQRWGGGL
jgi:hypothetical protein